MIEAPIRCIEDARSLEQLTEQLLAHERIALDTEANGMHAFAPQLCALQLGWLDGEEVRTAVVDPKNLGLEALAPLLEAQRPRKLIHDLTFDVRMLQQQGIDLGGVSDTSIAARFLGMKATGLASLVEHFFDVKLGKEFQRHNWALRPFSPEQLQYLAGDVAYLHALDARLNEQVLAAGIEQEVATECSYRLKVAQVPAPQRPPHERFKGFRKRPENQQRVLYCLLERRERIARERDVPAHWLAPNRMLADLAKRQPKQLAAVRRLCGRHRRALSLAREWLDTANKATREEFELPSTTATATPPQEQLQQRKRTDTMLSRWRKAQAEERGVDLQVIVPGHCMGGVAEALLQSTSTDIRLNARLEAIGGFGSCRVTRYGKSLAALAERVLVPKQEGDNEPSQPAPATASSN
jgi:ribonuclease D